ncbi:hypothetical protein OQA88_9431 [Cercophora sp. LCS_1]
MTWLRRKLSSVFGVDRSAGYGEYRSSSDRNPTPPSPRSSVDVKTPSSQREPFEEFWGPVFSNPFWEPAQRANPETSVAVPNLNQLLDATFSTVGNPPWRTFSRGPTSWPPSPGPRTNPTPVVESAARYVPTNPFRRKPLPQRRPSERPAEETRSPDPWIVDEEKDCIICTESKPTTSFPLLCVSRDCNHAPETCLDCLQRHIKTAIEDKAWHAKVVTCPECNSPMGYNEVQSHADRATFETYDARVLNDAIAQQSDWFSCPGAGCSSAQIHDATDGAAPIVTCIGCRRKYCFRHCVPWHDTMSCDEYDRFLADPENFRSTFELENERVEQEREAQERLRQEMEAADRRLAQSLVEEQARAEAEAQARREEAARAEAARRRAEERAAQQRAEAAERARAAEDAKRKARENAASEDTVKRTTKNCPGCGGPIEKNQGW